MQLNNGILMENVCFKLKLKSWGTFIYFDNCLYLALLPWPERVKRSIENFENEREETRREQQVIGKIHTFGFWSHKRISSFDVGQVLDKTQPEDRIHVKAKLVRFSWQRGVKIGKNIHIGNFFKFYCIGQGTFGKVYTAINNETGDIMAMKEIPLQPNDHKTLRWKFLNKKIPQTMQLFLEV
jgi:hypothetical protein